MRATAGTASSITHGTRNLFADLGYLDAAARQGGFGWAKVLAVASAPGDSLRRYRLAGFDMGRLMALLVALGH